MRLARDCARNPVARERLTYGRTAKAVTYCSDKLEGPTAIAGITRGFDQRHGSYRSANRCDGVVDRHLQEIGDFALSLQDREEPATHIGERQIGPRLEHKSNRNPAPGKHPIAQCHVAKRDHVDDGAGRA